MVACYSAKAVATRGGATKAQTDGVPFQGTMKSTISWQLKFAVTLAFQNRRSSNPRLKGSSGSLRSPVPLRHRRGRLLSYPLSRFGFDFQKSAKYSLCIKVNEILVRLQNDGWYLVTTRGSHRQFKHPQKPGRVTVAGKPSDELAPGTLNSILKQASLK